MAQHFWCSNVGPENGAIVLMFIYTAPSRFRAIKVSMSLQVIATIRCALFYKHQQRGSMNLSPPSAEAFTYNLIKYILAYLDWFIFTCTLQQVHVCIHPVWVTAPAEQHLTSSFQRLSLSSSRHTAWKDVHLSNCGTYKYTFVRGLCI